MKAKSILNSILEFFGIFRGEVDADFLDAYKKILLGQYRSIARPPTPSVPAHPAPAPAAPVDPYAHARAEADAIAGRIERNEAIEWEDLYRLELAIVKLEPEPMLQRRAWILRNEYEELASAEEVADYKASKPPSENQTTKAGWDLLRADLVRLQEELNWRYVSLWTLERFRGLLMNGVFWSGILVLLIYGGLAASVMYFFHLNGTLLWLIAAAGVVGGLASTLRRVQEANLSGNTDVELAGMNNGNLSIYLSPGLGGLFALVLACLIASGLLSGAVFPTLKAEMFCGTFECSDFANRDIAKLLIWSFIAGFSERFVPDRLAKLASDAPQPDIKKIAKKKAQTSQ